MYEIPYIIIKKKGVINLGRTDIIKRLIDEKWNSRSSFAKSIGMPPTTLQSILERGVGKASIDNILKICEGLDITTDELQKMSKNPTLDLPNIIHIQPKFVKLPLLGEIACGEPLLAEEQIIGYVWELEESLPHGELFALKAKGRSMEPTIPNGSTVIARQQNDVENGELAVVLVNGEAEATLKRVKKQGSIVLLMPDNPKYEPIVVNFDNPARIIGKVVRLIKDFT